MTREEINDFCKKHFITNPSELSEEDVKQIKDILALRKARMNSKGDTITNKKPSQKIGVVIKKERKK